MVCMASIPLSREPESASSSSVKPTTKEFATIVVKLQINSKLRLWSPFVIEFHQSAKLGWRHFSILVVHSPIFKRPWTMFPKRAALGISVVIGFLFQDSWNIVFWVVLILVCEGAILRHLSLKAEMYGTFMFFTNHKRRLSCWRLIKAFFESLLGWVIQNERSRTLLTSWLEPCGEPVILQPWFVADLKTPESNQREVR